MLKNTVTMAVDSVCILYNLFIDCCHLLYTNTHAHIPVNKITRSLCPVLMSRSITPILWHTMIAPDRLFLVLFFYVYAI